jgi:hypothetical protein
MFRHSEAAIEDKTVIEIFKTEYVEVMEQEGYFPQQVFTLDNTGFF